MLKIKAFKDMSNKIYLNFNLDFNFLYEGFKEFFDKFSEYCDKEIEEEYIANRFIELRNRFLEDGKDAESLLFALLYMYGAIHLAEAAVDFLGGVDKLGTITSKDLKNLLEDRFGEFMGVVMERAFLMLALVLFAMTDREIGIEVDDDNGLKN